MKKQRIIIATLSFLLVVSVIGNYALFNQHNKTVDYTIYPSPLPANELWRVEQAEQIYSRAFSEAFCTVNPDLMIELLKHAWQWDKNAMTSYYWILMSKDVCSASDTDDDLFIDNFMQQYQDKIVDSYGNKLTEPDIFKRPDAYKFMRQSLADLKYPRASLQLAWIWRGPHDYDNNGFAKPRNNESIENALKYLSYAMVGGYRKYETLATWTLFDIMDNFKDEKHKIIIPLTEYRPSLPPVQLAKVMDNYQIAASHSSLISIVRISEAYLYGIGREHDLVKAYAWSQFANYVYHGLIERNKGLAWNRYTGGETIAKYNDTLNEQLANTLNDEQKLASTQHLEQLKLSIIDWDDRIWSKGVDDFNPKP